MKKAMMYLLLALGITLVVMFIGGAMVGLIAGFIDGFSGNQVGTSDGLCRISFFDIVMYHSELGVHQTWFCKLYHRPCAKEGSLEGLCLYDSSFCQSGHSE